MTWQVMEYMDNNPQASTLEVMAHFAEELEVDQQLHYLKKEVQTVLTIREQLRPLYGKKMNAESNLALLDSDLEMMVMVKYPPRQGSDKERKTYKKELQQNHSEYQELFASLQHVKEEIEGLEYQMEDCQQQAKNARRIVEVFCEYMKYLSSRAIEPIRAEASNADIF